MSGVLLHPLQDLLARAALDPDPRRAADAQRRWGRRVDLDRLDFGSVQMLGLLAARSEGLAVADPRLADHLVRIARMTWLRTEVLLHRVGDTVTALGKARLDPVLAKGAALVTAHGADTRTRPMFDVDVLIAPEHLSAACAVLRDLGYGSALEQSIERYPAAVLAGLHAAEFRNGEDARIDLHWHAFHAARHPALIRAVRDAAQPVAHGGWSARATSAEDTLVMSVAHGARWTATAALRWLGDAALLVGREDLRWERVVERCRQARLGRLMLDALDFLEDVASLGAPAEARRALGAAPTPVAVALRRRRRADPLDGAPSAPGRLGRLADAYEEDVVEHTALAARTSPLHGARFLARRWGLGGVAEVPVHAAWVLAGRPWSGRTAAALRRPTVRPGSLPAYVPGDELRFDATGAGGHLLGPGWWCPEAHGTYSRAPVATLWLPLADGVDVDQALEIWLHAPLGERRPAAPVEVVVDGFSVLRGVVDEVGEALHLHGTVPGAVLAGRDLVELSIVATPLSPAELRMSSDLRQIGVGLVSLRLGPAPASPLQFPPPGDGRL